MLVTVVEASVEEAETVRLVPAIVPAVNVPLTFEVVAFEVEA